jgi:hypothetical protein
MSEAKNKKLVEQFTEKAKQDAERLKRSSDDELKRVEDDFYAKL